MAPYSIAPQAASELPAPEQDLPRVTYHKGQLKWLARSRGAVAIAIATAAAAAMAGLAVAFVWARRWRIARHHGTRVASLSPLNLVAPLAWPQQITAVQTTKGHATRRPVLCLH